MKLIIVIIILLLPLSVVAHGLEPTLKADPGKIPGEIFYFFERPAEWLEVNIFTVSTKKKQEKRLEFASERVAELGALLYLPSPKERNLKTALARYEYYLGSAEDMAEKIIFLDGAEIGVADRFEEESRLQEKFLHELKEGGPSGKFNTQIDEALKIARDQNEKIFRFMVEKYQGNEADIRKHKLILVKHITLAREVMESLKDESRLQQADALLVEAEKFRKAGLNIETYELINQAKNLVY